MWFFFYSGCCGLAGIVTFAVEQNDKTDLADTSYGWALALVAAGSGLAVLCGVGFCVSGLLFEDS